MQALARTVLSSLAFALLALGSNSASAAPFSQYWFMDWLRGCLRMPRPPYAQPELRGAIETVPQRFKDGDADVIRVTYSYPYNGGGGTLVWVSDETFCRSNLARYRADDLRMQRGNAPLIGAGQMGESSSLIYSYDRWKNVDLSPPSTLATTPPDAPLPATGSSPPAAPAINIEIAWTAKPSVDQFIAALPADRDYAGVTARITMHCTATVAGGVEGCVVSDARPMGMNLERAALATSGELRFSVKGGTYEQAAGHNLDVVLVVEMTDEAQTRVRLGPQVQR
jgi:hypothetical protein